MQCTGHWSSFSSSIEGALGGGWNKLCCLLRTKTRRECRFREKEKELCLLNKKPYYVIFFLQVSDHIPILGDKLADRDRDRCVNIFFLVKLVDIIRNLSDSLVSITWPPFVHTVPSLHICISKHIYTITTKVYTHLSCMLCTQMLSSTKLNKVQRLFLFCV